MKRYTCEFYVRGNQIMETRAKSLYDIDIDQADMIKGAVCEEENDDE